jgi:hypothetical protein
MIITLELEKLNTVLRKPVEEMDAEERWAVFTRFCADKSKRGLINELLAQEEGIAMAGQTMRGFTREQLEYFRETSELKWELDRRAYEDDLREEGRAESQQALAEKDQALIEKNQEIAELKRQLESR